MHMASFLSNILVVCNSQKRPFGQILPRDKTKTDNAV